MDFNQILNDIITRLIVAGITSIVKYIIAKLKPKISNIIKKILIK